MYELCVRVKRQRGSFVAVKHSLGACCLQAAAVMCLIKLCGMFGICACGRYSISVVTCEENKEKQLSAAPLAHTHARTHRSTFC